VCLVPWREWREWREANVLGWILKGMEKWSATMVFTLFWGALSEAQPFWGDLVTASCSESSPQPMLELAHQTLSVAGPDLQWKLGMSPRRNLQNPPCCEATWPKMTLLLKNHPSQFRASSQIRWQPYCPSFSTLGIDNGPPTCQSALSCHPTERSFPQAIGRRSNNAGHWTLFFLWHDVTVEEGVGGVKQPYGAAGPHRFGWLVYWRGRWWAQMIAELTMHAGSGFWAFGRIGQNRVPQMWHQCQFRHPTNGSITLSLKTPKSSPHSQKKTASANL
jgi:hypothetical protein